MDELRIVLLGKQGVGKSSSGNTLLGKNTFHTAVSSQRVTQFCLMGMSTVNKQKIRVIDTPGWSDSSLSGTEIKQEILKCIHMSSPGPHVFLLVLPIGRFTNEEINTVMNILEEFGDEVNKYMIVLFTRGDDLEERSIEDYLEEVHPHLKKIIQICGGRYHVFNNKNKKNNLQVSSLLQKIKHMVERKELNYYTIDMHQKAKDQQTEERRRQKSIRRILKKQSGGEAENSVLDKSINKKKYSEREQSYLKKSERGTHREREKHQEQKEREGNRTIQQQNSIQDREQEFVKDGLQRKQGQWKNTLEKKHYDTRMWKDNYNVDRDTLDDRTELQLRQKIYVLNKTMHDKELKWSQEKARLVSEIDQLKNTLEMQEQNLKKTQRELEIEKQKSHIYEELEQDDKQRKERIKRLEQRQIVKKSPKLTIKTFSRWKNMWKKKNN